METVLAFNGLLFGICTYFVKEYISEFKELGKKVERIDQKVNDLSDQINRQRA